MKKLRSDDGYIHKNLLDSLVKQSRLVEFIYCNGMDLFPNLVHMALKMSC